MRKLLGMAVLLVALPACATARSIGDVSGEALSDLGCAVSGATACAPEATVKPLVSEPVSVTTVAEDAAAADEEPSLLDRRPTDAPAPASPGLALGSTQPPLDIPWRSYALQSAGVGIHWSLAPDVTVGPAVEWCTERDAVVDERLTLGLTLRF